MFVMVECSVQVGNVEVKYFQKGENPVWLMYSGTHGDEAGVVLSIEKYVRENADRLPDFLWVPHVSPSAVQKKTRHNERGLDTNRNFLDGAVEEEIVANFEIVRGKTFAYFLDFHEDPVRRECYVYDSLGIRDEIMEAFFALQKRSGFELLTGLDDEEDTALGNMVIDGYCDASGISETSGFTVDYMLTRGIVQKRAWTFETPGLCTQEEKDLMIKNIFENHLKFLTV